MNIGKIFGCHILLVTTTCLGRVLSDSSNSTNVTITTNSTTFQSQPFANATSIRIQTLDQQGDLPCLNNCSTSIVDEEQSTRKKRRKRRRNRKPISSANRYSKMWNNRRPAAASEQHYSRKKYSTRVYLDKPVQFVDHFVVPSKDNSVSQLSPNSAAAAIAVETTTKFDTKIASPVRFLLPPFVDKYFVGNAATSELGRKKPSRYELPPNNRGPTKFKNTVYYDDKGDLLSNEIQYTTPLSAAAGFGDEKRQKTKFRPIVVANERSVPYEMFNFSRIESNSATYDDETSKLVSPEVAKAGMNAIAMKPQTDDVAMLFSSNENFPKTATNAFLSSFPYRGQNRETTTEEQKNEIVEQTIENEPTIEEGLRDYQPMRDDSTKYAGQQIREYDNFRRDQSSQKDSSMQWNHQPQSNGNYSTWDNRMTSESNSKSLELAESSYFPDLPSLKEELQTTAYDGNQVIPGKAGKDYPIFSQTFLPKRRFACRGLQGYFADLSTRCQVFYICNGNGAGEPMLCPNGTLFSQELLVCDWWYNVDC